MALWCYHYYQLRTGAYGYVWRCRDKTTDRIVAVKGFKQAHEDPEVSLSLVEILLLQIQGHFGRWAVHGRLSLAVWAAGISYILLSFLNEPAASTSSDAGMMPAPICPCTLRCRLCGWRYGRSGSCVL